MTSPILIVGGGPAGLSAAHSLAMLGQKSILVEKHEALGGAPLISGYAKLVPSGEWAKDGPCMMHYHIVAPGFIAITYDYERLGRRIVAGFPSPLAYDSVQIFWGVANERGYRGADLAECLNIEDLLYREDLPVAASIEPREIDWDGQAIEYSVPADLYTLNYRRAFKEFIERASPARTR